MFKSIVAGIFTYIVSLVGGGTTVYVAPTPTPVLVNSTTTAKNIATSTTTNIEKSTTTKKTSATSTPKAKVIAKTTPKPEVKIETKPQIQDFPLPDFEKVNTFSRQAIVNILCTTKGNELSPVSGTGVFISPKGIILTNAHIAQYLLLKDFGEKDRVACIIRTGSPAYPKYNTELVYISPVWVKNNSDVLKQQNPQGTGENDFAFLRIKDAINGDKLPETFPYIIPDIRENIENDEPVLLVSYPAGFLGGLSIIRDLNITSSITNIQSVFTFKENTIDLISIGGTVVSQKGSSGGAVVDKYVSLLGIISTSSEGSSTNQRDLRAITLAHINRALQSEIGVNLDGFLNYNSKVFAETFASTTAPLLTKIIADELKK